MATIRSILSSKDLRGVIVAHTFDKLFFQWNEGKGARSGLHASSVVQFDDEWCYREHVLNHFYEGQTAEHPARTLRIFYHGWVMHEKWQRFFMDYGLADRVETTEKSAFYRLSFTPDAILKMDIGKGLKRYVWELKGMHTAGFQKLNEPPENAVRQANLYMHMLAIPQAVIHVEDKNTQEHKCWVIEYDPEIVRPFIGRILTFQKMLTLYPEKTPKRHAFCTSITEKRATKCPMKEICFSEYADREPFRRP